MDGIDGLVGGVSFISAMSLLAVSAQFPTRAAATLLLAALAGSALGFLRHNFHPSRIIMGDAGAYFFGYVLAATAILGIEESAVDFLGLPDGAIPTQGSPDFSAAVKMCRDRITALTPDTVFLPWRFDPHPDHRATWQLIHQALEVVSASPRLSLTASSPLATYQSPRLIEYPIWDWDPKQRSNLPEPDFVKVWRLDISAVVQLKQQAIAAYRSQTTDLIDDDPEGFQLTLEMLANFTRPWELYLEVIQ